MNNEEKDVLEEVTEETNEEVVEEASEEVVVNEEDTMEEEYEEDDMLIHPETPEAPEIEEVKKESKTVPIVIGVGIALLIVLAMMFTSDSSLTTPSSNSLVCDYVYDTMTLSQVIEYDDEGTIAVSNYLVQTLTQEELDSYGLTFEEYIAENETSMAEADTITGTEFTISGDEENMEVVIGLVIYFDEYDFDEDYYGLGTADTYLDTATIEETLVSYGYTCYTE